ncbi:hypothetical protein [Persicobacter psychrovividus]|uniref:Uncharacterized protein n=1 Tax=Persicobacter psychrovividus TaxID=387638 RepID=A0ABM7VHA5_9BACT|nr:hypothetical protein PEPS_26060 [Persicobacter psychrovividus]
MKKYLIIASMLLLVGLTYKGHPGTAGEVTVTFLADSQYLNIRNLKTDIIGDSSVVQLGHTYHVHEGSYSVKYDVLTPGKGWVSKREKISLKSDKGRDGSAWRFNEKGSDIDYVFYIDQELRVRKSIRNFRKVIRSTGADQKNA